MLKKIDVLWLVEHTVREMDVACAVKSLAQARYGMNITIRNIYLHANEVMREYFPSIVVFPFLYRISDLAINDYVEAWPGAIYFNLAWEQVHYKAHLRMKAPGDVFTRNKVTHHAWGEFYKNYLIKSDVPSEHIFVNGNPAYQLYKEPYNKYFKQRGQLAQENGIDPAKRWVFVPENYKWAFFSDEKLKRSAEKGGNMEEHLKMRAFCRESLAQVLKWCNETGKNDALEIIFRPRPATNSQHMETFFRENVNGTSTHLHFTKADTVRDWIMASDVVFSSYSTSLIESAIAGKPIYMLEPIPIPESLYCDWYELVPRIHSIAEFEEACFVPKGNNDQKLQTWAQDTMLSNGDPIAGLANFIAELANDTGPLLGSRVNSLASDNQLPALVSLIVKFGWKSRRLARYTGYAIHSLLSAVKVFILHLVSPFIPKGMKQEAHPKETVSRRVLERLKRASHHIVQGVKGREYYNPVTHENDEFTEVEIEERVVKWNEILADN